ncbi:MAG: L,D-transpeptidase family protein [Sporichthyaceae bacterium]
MNAPRHRVHREGRFPALLPSAVASTLSAVLLVAGSFGSPEHASASQSRLFPSPELGLSTLLPSGQQPAPKAKPAKDPAWARGLPANTTQVVRTVRSNEWCSQVYCARTEAWERVDGTWRLAKGPGKSGKAVFRSQIGARGFAPPGKRRQNDLRSPSGVFGIKVVFSTSKDRPTEMPWRRRLPTSVVSSTPGQTYNTWIEAPGVRAGDRRMMSWGFWIDYNNPRLAVGKGPRPVPGLGSGIFLHTSNAGRPWAATLACVQIGVPAQAEWIVRWLEPDANPRVVNNR